MPLEPFTYQHFLMAFHYGKSDLYYFYIDYAVGIYCNIVGKSVRPRPASPADYDAEYSVAFEAANAALGIVAHKIGSYNPQKPFKPYLNAALEHAIRDVLRENRGKVPIDWSVNIDDVKEPDTEAGDRAERIRQHKDDAFETMIRFIDRMPEKKRAAIYASAFGHILRPDLQEYGRDYAQILALVYKTTAEYIRKMAAEGKNAALAEAQRYGFSARSMGEVSMGFLQAKSNVKDPNDMVIEATEKLTPSQQLKFMRYLADKVDDSTLAGLLQ